MKYFFTISFIILNHCLGFASDLQCGRSKSPELAAAVLTITFAQNFGENIALAKCKAGDEVFCRIENQKRNGILELFNVMKQFPTVSENPDCELIRNFCITKCETTKLFNSEDCHKGCLSEP